MSALKGAVTFVCELGLVLAVAGVFAAWWFR